MYEADEKLCEVEALSEESKKVKIFMKNGDIIVGESWGIEPAFDAEGEELPYNCLAFVPDGQEYPISILNRDILRVEKA